MDIHSLCRIIRFSDLSRLHYYAVINGMKNFSLFIVGIIMLVFAGMFHIYRHGRTMTKAPPPSPKPAPPVKGLQSIPSIPESAHPKSSIGTTEKPLVPPPVQKSTTSQSSSEEATPSRSRNLDSKSAAVSPYKISANKRMIIQLRVLQNL